MERLNFDDLVTPSRTYWVLDGTSKSYDLKEEIKSWGGYWVKEHKAWCIDNPDETAIRVLKSAGLQVQFRRYGK